MFVASSAPSAHDRPPKSPCAGSGAVQGSIERRYLPRKGLVFASTTMCRPPRRARDDGIINQGAFLLGPDKPGPDKGGRRSDIRPGFRQRPRSGPLRHGDHGDHDGRCEPRQRRRCGHELSRRLHRRDYRRARRRGVVHRRSVDRADLALWSETTYSAPGIDAPAEITSGPDGALWFTNEMGGPDNEGSIGRITTSGTISIFTDPSIFQPFGITSGPGKSVWFTNQYGSDGHG